ncbi:MAG: Hemolysins and related proteins containing CBS domains [uncultured Nocardioidaceae bacterium]|uniref:Hemolysins and related proteins containing CBS domains n=1 Tax=uncultured Nocardioidaceae bacterium TaxID=253824 RepID=A0A6J4LW36_9ACTN|nr:MAG: Hemolysins and related proteins containing CBS domains [uncultured Nocardioidaceae bacterium]
MNGSLSSIGLVVLFVLIGSVFVAAETALVSLRDSQARSLAINRGRRGRIVAGLNQDPNRFLASVQVGVTLSGFLSAAFGAATLADDLAPYLEPLGLSTSASETAALIAMTLVISYVSLVFGELVPKRLALQRAESFALSLGPLIDRMSRLSRPVIWLLSLSTNLVVRLLGGNPEAKREQMSDEELREIVGSHSALGDEERQILEDVFQAGDRQIREVMVPRTEVDFLDASAPVHQASRQAISQPHSRYPVIRASADDVIGFVHVRDLLDPDVVDRSVRVGEMARDILTLPWTRPLLSALTDMRREGIHLAVVADEYGGTAGIVTMEDLVEELVGDIRDEYDVEESETTRHLSGDVEVDGLLNRDDFEDETGIELPEGPYETVAGYLMSQLGRIPRPGDVVELEGHRITVLTVEGRRVSRVRVTVAPPPAVAEPV